MSVDPAGLQGMATRMRGRLAEEATSRARRQQRSGEGAFGARSFAAGWHGSGLPVGDVAAPRVAASRFRLEDPPRGRGAPGMARGAAASRRLAPSGDRASTAALLASGYQPAVLKVISYGHGIARATAIGQYIQRDEAALETHDGRLLATQEAVAVEMKDWARDFDKRRESDDVAMFRLSVTGEGDRERLVQAVEAAFAGHPYAYRIEEVVGGEVSARVVAAMAGHDIVAGENGDEKVRHRFHLSDRRSPGARQLSAPTRTRIAKRVAAALAVPPESVRSMPVGDPSHGKAGVVFQLSRLTHDGQAIGEDGRSIAGEMQVRATAQAWSKGLNSFTPRDTMHVILSAKAGVDKEALVRAARGFLHHQFPEHKFAFALHDDKEEDGHMHVHAIVAVKGEDGQRLRPGPADLRAWREVYAAQAQGQGLKIVATSAAYRASSQSYGPRDKAIVDVAEHPREGREARDRAYARANPHVIDRARQRIELARINPVRVPVSARQLQAAREALQDWQALARTQPDQPDAAHYTARLTQSLALGHVLVSLHEYRKASSMADANAAQMRENLKGINEAVTLAAGVMEGATKMEFLRRTAETMERIAVQADLKAEQEKGRTHLTEAEARQMLGPRADALIARAREIQAAEELEAQRAETIRSRAIEEEVRDDRSGAADPASLQEVADERAAVRNAESIAARERQEAQAASEVARALAENPGQKLDPNLVQGERLEDLKRAQQRVYNKDGIDITGADEEPQAQKPSGQRI